MTTHYFSLEMAKIYLTNYLFWSFFLIIYNVMTNILKTKCLHIDYSGSTGMNIFCYNILKLLLDILTTLQKGRTHVNTYQQFMSAHFTTT